MTKEMTKKMTKTTESGLNQYYLHFLFEKHILVNAEAAEDRADAAGERDERFEVLFSLANLFGIRIISGEKLVTREMLRLAEKELGQDVPLPFYEGFPESVRALTPDQLLFDQLYHYARTYGLGDFSQPGHSVLEEKPEIRGVFDETAFKKGALIREFSVVTESEAKSLLQEMVMNLLQGSRPLSAEQFLLVETYVRDFDPDILEIGSKNTAVRLLLDTRDLRYAEFISLSDVIKLLDELQYRVYESENLKKLNLRNQDRKFLTKVMDTLFEAGRVDIRTCYEKKKIWNGLLHHIHYQGKTDLAKSFADAIRGQRNESVFSEFEAAMKERKLKAAVDILEKGKGSGALLRNLNYIVSRCTSTEDMDYVFDHIKSANVILLLQLLLRYGRKERGGARTFAFVRHELMTAHVETPDEAARRKSGLSIGQTEALEKRIRENLKTVLAGRLGKVYIDPSMKNYALPLQEAVTQGGFGVLTRGSRIHIDKAPIIRAFTYWEKVNDIDLSCFGLDEMGNSIEFSWRTMSHSNSEAITYSGDETSGYNGGSEYFDIDPEKIREIYPTVRYMIFCNNVYSGSNFSKCVCRAGYMLRDPKDKGQIYEPKTVQSSYTVNCESTFAYLFGIDLMTMDLLWLNVARSGGARVAGETAMTFLLDYFHVTEIVNFSSFFEMMASEITDRPEEAEVIITDKSDVAKAAREDQEVIREYDIEKMIALING